MVKSIRPVVALVAFLERLVMTVLEGAITNDQFLACTSVSTKAFWDWTTFLGLSCSSDSSGMTLGNWSSAKGKVNTIKTRHVMIRKLILLGT